MSKRYQEINTYLIEKQVIIVNHWTKILSYSCLNDPKNMSGMIKLL